MTKDDLKKRRVARVYINCPSTLQPHHKLHGTRCIAVYENPEVSTVRVFFTEGTVVSMEIDPLYLSEC